MQVAVFDTSFHQTLAPEAFLYGLPWEYYQNLGVRRYGFHGTSHRYVSRRALALLGLPEQESGLVIAHGQWRLDLRGAQRPQRGHLDGNDAAGGADDGHPQRRCRLRRHGVDCRGDPADPQRHRWVANTASGLLGISGLSSDLRVLEQAWHEGHARARGD